MTYAKCFLIKRLLAGIFCLLLVTPVQASLTAQVDRAQIQQNESLYLTLLTSESLSGSPNFQVLSQDFDWSRPSQRSSTQIINGRRQHSSSWSVELMPKRSGQLTIPAFTVDGYTSQPITITVKPGPQTTAEKIHNSPVFMTQDISNDNPYVQEPIQVTFKVHAAVNLIRGNLSDWTVDHAQVEQLEEQTQYRTQLQGKTYQVTEIHFWVTPQKSGPMTLPSLRLTAEVSNRGQRLSLPFGGRSGQRISDSVPEKMLQVKPKPTHYPADAPWLPAQSLSIQETWEPNTRETSVGDALTRTIKVNIQGQWPELIPTLTFSTNNDIKVYADQPQLDSQRNTQRIQGQKTLTYAIVPTVAGSLSLPETQITWWNTQTDQLETTSIKAQPISALAASGNIPMASSEFDTTSTLSPDTRLATQPLGPIQSANAQPFWVVLTSLFAGLWLITLAIMAWLAYRLQQLKLPQPKTPIQPIVTVKHSLRNLKLACQSGELPQIENSIIEWAHAYWPANKGLTSLGHIQEQVSLPAAKAALTALQNKRYNPAEHDMAWSADSLYAAIKQVSSMTQKLESSKSQTADMLLAPLRPA